MDTIVLCISMILNEAIYFERLIQILSKLIKISQNCAVHCNNKTLSTQFNTIGIVIPNVNIVT